MDENRPDDSNPAPSPLASLTPEQMRVMLAAGSQRGPAPAAKGGALFDYWNRRRFIVALIILGCGVFYALFKTANSPAWVVIINSSGADARAVTVVRGGRRVELGEMANGESQKVEVTPGETLTIEYTFDVARVWRTSNPLLSYETLNIVLAPGGGVQAERDTPWSRKKSTN